MNYNENMPIGKLMEHPSNQKLFKDIKESNPVFWIEFVDSIKTFGIIEPLIVNRESMQVRSGNQRLKAAIELGIESVPVLLVDDEETDAEISKMIASNVFRRTIDPFSMFEYIGRLRNPTFSQEKVPNVIETGRKVHKQNNFVSAADIFKTLPEDQQESLKEWFTEQAEGEKAKSEGELIAMIKNLERNQTTLEEELRKQKEEADQFEYDFTELKAQKEAIEEKVSDYEADIQEKETEIKELLDTDYEVDKERKIATIKGLENDKKKLNDKIKELQGLPDINKIVLDISTKMSDCYAKMISVMDHSELINKTLLDSIEYTANEIINIIGDKDEL